MSDIQARVARGATWLDAAKLGWWQRIDVVTLHMGDACNCVLGQCYGDYSEGHQGYEWSVAHGFYLECEHGHSCTVKRNESKPWQQLKDVWVTEILTRRFAQHESQPEEQPCETIS